MPTFTWLIAIFEVQQKLYMHTQSQSEVFSFLPRNRVLRHILFWIWVYLLDVVFFGIGFEDIKRFAKFGALEMPGQIFFAYAAIYWIMPQYMAKKKLGEAVLITVVAFFTCGFITQCMFKTFAATAPDESIWDVPKIMLRAFYCFLKACIAILIKIGLLWLDNERRIATLEKTKLASELKMLKDQVNPHFMFNTLNNLYGLVGKDPAQAQESILRLSGILQFMLHESNLTTIPVRLELKCIQDYIELEKIRYAGILSVAVNTQRDVNDLSIVPLILFPFVENSFKHGASELIKDAWVNIDISTYKGDFIFKISNGKRSIDTNGGKSGIGLYNVKRRLELIYAEDHSLQIIDDNDNFLVILKIRMERMANKHVVTHEDEMSYR
jgi:two-component system, LytTR family, sensor kinase